MTLNDLKAITAKVAAIVLHCIFDY